MAHFIRHHPPKYELVRGESVKHTQYRKVFCEQRAQVEKSRPRTSGLWWTDQRYVDQVVPAHFVHPDFLDTFNYRYQVYARPPPLRVPPRSLAEASDQQVPVSYNVKRMAVDKVWAPGHPLCAHHWSKQPWQVTCCPPIKRETEEDCSQNNSKPLHEQPYLSGRSDGMCPVQHQTSTFNSNQRRLNVSGVDFLKNQNSLRCAGSGHDTGAHSAGDPDSSASNNSADTVDSKKCDDVRGQHKQSDCECSNTSHPDNEVGYLCQQGTSACGNTESRTEMMHVRSDTACMPARLIANHNKNKVNRDRVASLLCNQNNNSSNDLTNESGTMVIIDNLIGTDNEDIGNSSSHHQTTFTASQRSYIQPEVYSHNEVVNLSSRSSTLWYDYSLCRNNNAECGAVSHERPGCIPRQCSDYSSYTPSPYHLDMPEMKTSRKPHIKATPCVEILGHLQSRTKPRCFTNPTARPPDRRSSEVTTETAYDEKMYDLGYKTHKIIGGKQYRLPPPKDYTADVRLPQHLEEYREFTRRCPNPHVGRFDRSDPANEMLLPGHITSNLIKVRRSPFVYTRNPKCYVLSPLFYTPRETGELCWSLPSAILNPQQ